MQNREVNYEDLVRTRLHQLNARWWHCYEDGERQTATELENALWEMAGSLQPLFLTRVTPTLVQVSRRQFAGFSDLYEEKRDTPEARKLARPFREELDAIFDLLRAAFAKVSRRDDYDWLPDVDKQLPGAPKKRFADWRTTRGLSNEEREGCFFVENLFDNLYHWLDAVLFFQGDMQKTFENPQNSLNDLEERFSVDAEEYEDARPGMNELPDELREAMDLEYANIQRLHRELQSKGYFRAGHIR